MRLAKRSSKRRATEESDATAEEKDARKTPAVEERDAKKDKENRRTPQIVLDI